MTLFDLDDIRDVVRKGALLYFDPDDLERVDDVTRDELAALSGKTDEKEEFEGWSLGPYACYMAAVLLSVSRVLFLYKMLFG